ncbi:hypothetical protein ACFPVS_12825 [Neisseria weixii]|uniref:EF-hand domain-containing protein n=1 Tax=Neisseria weixii TaxID=1853276 RepID=A0A3N4MYI7_9NEIS|nr:hypothetical protein [Neisseria weixii]ATD65452.1 hypothetical protein CGZ65_09495 [Neisseria weixii]RPD89052.1 hypothetical protein EGK74_05235 [Neisseria weixii]RPD89305.1 hypothetical protein EGK75_04830 [Neisseria weixii]
MKWMLTALLLAAVIPAQACEPDLAAKLFIGANDKNSDGVLTASEWANVDTAGLILNFEAGDAGAFKQLDRNRNGKIEVGELIHAVRFETSPCEGWPWQK